MNTTTIKNEQRKKVMNAWLKGYTLGLKQDTVRNDIGSSDGLAGFDACRKEMHSLHKRAFLYAEEVVPD